MQVVTFQKGGQNHVCFKVMVNGGLIWETFSDLSVRFCFSADSKTIGPIKN